MCYIFSQPILPVVLLFNSSLRECMYIGDGLEPLDQHILCYMVKI